MASVKIASLFLKTLSKPIANRLKRSAKEHERFREYTISFAQKLHRAEMTMRVKLLGETHPKHIRPLNDARAIDAGANFIAEAFLFAFAATIIVGENYRSARKESKRRDGVAESLATQASELMSLRAAFEEEREERARTISREKELEHIVDEIVAIGLKGGFLNLTERGSSDPAAGEKWTRHTVAAEAARRFGSIDRRKILGEDGDDGDAPDGKVPSMESRILEELERAGVDLDRIDDNSSEQ